MKAIRWLLPTLLLAACAETPPAPAPATPPAHDPVAALAAINGAAAGLDSAVQVHPLRDPAIDGFMKDARAAQAAHDLAAAASAANAALELSPDAPEILEYLAELAVARGDWGAAEQFATRSYTLGPKAGSLCARSAQVLVETRTARGDAAAAAQARQQVHDCRVPPRVRM